MNLPTWTCWLSAAGRRGWAMAAATGQAPRELDVAAIQAALRADGVDLTRGGEEQTITG